MRAWVQQLSLRSLRLLGRSLGNLVLRLVGFGVKGLIILTCVYDFLN